jgi:hypothetical protein
MITVFLAKVQSKKYTIIEKIKGRNTTSAEKKKKNDLSKCVPSNGIIMCSIKVCNGTVKKYLNQPKKKNAAKEKYMDKNTTNA